MFALLEIGPKTYQKRACPHRQGVLSTMVDSKIWTILTPTNSVALPEFGTRLLVYETGISSKERINPRLRHTIIPASVSDIRTTSSLSSSFCNSSSTSLSISARSSLAVDAVLATSELSIQDKSRNKTYGCHPACIAHGKKKWGQMDGGHCSQADCRSAVDAHECDHLPDDVAPAQPSGGQQT